MDTIPEGDFLTVVAHSLGCALWIHYVAQSHRRRADRVILVSPPSQWLSAETVDTHFPNADGRRMLRSFFPLPDDRTSLAKASDKTLFVISSNDPFLPPDQVHHYFDYDVPVMIIPGCGHINVGTGFGAWPSMLELCLNDAFPFPVVHPASSGHS
jgi:predicted alpha/beta hydrolase family esterase